ncbi:MAG: hypothetical protein L6R36_004347 [Xanthoria steineri]|nr:MAG: hypothetical protein L6R36_004347 [Xanthoria steineri]
MPGRRTRTQVPRGQTGNRYEQTIADLQSKVEQLSQSLHARSGARNETPSTVNSPHGRPDVPTEAIGDRGNSFEGDSSFMTHSKQVTQAFEASLASTPQIDVDDALSGAVANLHKALDSSNPPPLTPAYSAESPEHDDCHGLSNLPLPPSDVVLKLLKRAKVERQRIFDEVPALELTTIIKHCQKVFFATEPYSIATFIIVNVSLVLLLRGLSEVARKESQIGHPELAQYLAILPKNVDHAVRKLPLVSPHSIENITALHLACSLAIESSIQASPWDLISTAARMALSAGWHRLGRKPGDNEQRLKRITFWSIYAMDRSMALSLGRAPNIQDYDIQTDRLACPADIDSPMGPMLACWVEVGELQGQTYHQLYSAHAQTQATETKARAAEQLAVRCLEIQRRFRSNAKFEDHYYESLQVQEIGFHSLLTMIYRMVPPADSTHPLQFGNQCILSARTALNLHNRAWAKTRAPNNYTEEDWRIFVHWSTLFSPFVPFICVFGNVIAQSDLQDLALLGEFVSTLQSAAETTHTVRKLHHACSSFHQIAKVFVARHSQHVAPATTDTEISSTTWPPLDGNGEFTHDQLSDNMLSQHDWDLMLSEWDLGLGTIDARQMSSFLDLLPNTQ